MIAPAPTARPRLHLGAVDGIRAVAALYVMVCHAWFEPTAGYYTTPIMNRLFMSYGHIAVDVFIVVSGFCLMLPVVRNGGVLDSVSGFFRRRALRIVPAYYAAVILSSLYIVMFAGEPSGTVWDTALPLTAYELVGHLLLLHAVPLGWSSVSINYPLWSISVEWLIYLAMPLLVLSFRRVRTTTTLILAVGIGALAELTTGGLLSSLYPWYLGLFALGCAAAVHWETVGRRTEYICMALSLALWGTVGIVILVGRSAVFYQYVVVMDTIIGMATALGLVVMAREIVEGRPGPIARVVSWRPLVWIGGFSYSLYLVHAPMLHMLDMLWRLVVPATPELLYILLLGSSPIIIAVAYGFSRLFERPFLRSGRPKATAAHRIAASPANESPSVSLAS